MSRAMTVYKFREFKKILEKNGYNFERSSGDHAVFVNARGNHISVPNHGNGSDIENVITRRLIRQHNLVV